MTKRNPSRQRRLAILFFLCSQHSLLFELYNPLQTGKKVQKEENRKQEKGKEEQEGRAAWWEKDSWKKNVERCKEGANTCFNILQIVWVYIRLKYCWLVPFHQAVADASNKLKWAIGLMPGLDTMSGAKLCPKQIHKLTGFLLVMHFHLFTMNPFEGILAVFKGVCFSGGCVSKLLQQSKQFQRQSKILSNLHRTKGWEVCAVGTGGCRGKEAWPWGSTCFPSVKH